jgi:bifunctional non-homologous end joining protein LigD
MNPIDKCLAVAVPDHPVSYINFEGTISEGNYGAGKVFIWDKGFFEANKNAFEDLEKGKLIFKIFGEKLHGGFTFLRMHNQPKNWLLIKSSDEYADPNWKLETILETRK